MGYNGDPRVSRLYLRGLRIMSQLKYLNLLILHPDLLLFSLKNRVRSGYKIIFVLVRQGFASARYAQGCPMPKPKVRHLWRDILYRDTPHGYGRQVIRTMLEGRVLCLGTGCVPIHNVLTPIKILKNQPFLQKQPTMMKRKLVASTRSFI